MWTVTLACRAQGLSFNGQAQTSVLGSTENTLPFWLSHNTRGRIGKHTNLTGLASGRLGYELRNGSFLESGAGLLLRDNASDRDYLDELYLSYFFDSFYVTAGRKQRPELYRGLSATNENILWSLNSRPLPGISVGTTAPVMLLPGFGFEAKWEEFLMEEDRNVPWTRVHHKSLHVVIRPQRDWEVKAGLQHFVQWGGVSPEFGAQPVGLKDYLKIITGRDGGDNSISTEQQNSLGNHLGSWELSVSKDSEDHYLKLIYNNIFEDGSGSRLANFPDGRYGIFFDFKNSDRLVKAIMYEFYYTRDQSKTGPHLYDQYFNSYLYQSGWTYYQQVIGTPFFTYDAEQERIINNKFIAHHFGISGTLLTEYSSYPYKLLLSYSHNEGTYGRPFIPSDEDALYTYLSTRLYNSIYDNLQLNLEIGADFSSLKAPNYGAGVSLKYVLK